ncbi:biotin--[acetyl-CoA-carboxylase] ligase [Marinicella sediminis]|uniref:biotin--[biotin carboxyl-carrier protein] ligase n=1 Tax=Marinicella sediminis TaxID=1792834 RepID=A0ABV7J3H0_9GAMM|nr:biotin--[acetyl-CoA-carboxylase] ligase [Marinicella sediminis]
MSHLTASQQLIARHHPEIQVDWVETIDSTQSRVRPNSLLISEHQGAGVGRRGNHWLTPSGQAICLSYRFTLPLTANQMHGYALVVGLSIAATIRHFDPTAQPGLKWPNDLYHQGQKFGGILINLHTSTNNGLDITVGIGINWTLDQTQLDSVNQPVTNIPLKQPPARAEFISQLITRIKTNNQRFTQRGWPAFLSDWLPLDVLLDQLITVQQDGQQHQGLCQGVDEQGRLLVLIDGRMKHFSGGQVSVRAI